MRKIALIWILLIFAVRVTGWAQQMTMERLAWQEIWAGRAASGMVQMAPALDTLGSVSRFNVHGHAAGGAFKDYWEGASAGHCGMETASYMKWGKVVLRGRFRYDYGREKDVQWRGWIYPDICPYMLADSVKGHYALEQYDMEAAVGMPLSSSLAFGAEASYKTYSGSKHKDLRNRNTHMDVTVRPSLLWHGKGTALALEGHLGRTTEYTDFTQVETSTNKTLFSFAGMWFNTHTVYSPTTPSTRMLRNLTAGGKLHIAVHAGSLDFFSETGAYFTQQKQDQDAVSPEHYGHINRMEITQQLVLLLAGTHRLTLEGSYRADAGYKPVQRQELNEKSRLYEYVVYDWLQPYNQKGWQAVARYDFHGKDVRGREGIKGWVDLSAKGLQRDYEEFPLHFSQYWVYWATEAGGTFSLYARKLRWDLSVKLQYGHGSGSMLEKKELTDNQTLPAHEGWQVSEGLEREFAFACANRFGTGLALRVNLPLKQKNRSLYAEAGGGYVRALSGMMNGMSRHILSLSIGFDF